MGWREIGIEEEGMLACNLNTIASLDGSRGKWNAFDYDQHVAMQCRLWQLF